VGTGDLVQKQYMYTVDHFTETTANHLKEYFNFLQLNDNIKLDFLDIGSFEGKSTIFQLENALKHPDSQITCIDTWDDPLKQTLETNNDLFERFKHNIVPYADKVSIVRGRAQEALLSAEVMSKKYDFIYVDASRRSRDVLETAVLAFPLLKINGVILFNDYFVGG
jgi:predicted O-methyltransferase YrrM